MPALAFALVEPDPQAFHFIPRTVTTPTPTAGNRIFAGRDASGRLQSVHLRIVVVTVRTFAPAAAGAVSAATSETQRRTRSRLITLCPDGEAEGADPAAVHVGEDHAR